MKIIFTYLIVLLFLSCTSDERRERSLIIQPTLNRSYDTSYMDRGIGNVKAYDIRLALMNKTKKPISFWIMKCSWEQNFIIDNKDIGFYGEECNGNFPVTKNINSNDTLVYSATLFTTSTKTKKYNKIRIGLIYVDASRYPSYEDYLSVMHDKSKQDSIVWSVPLQLN